MSPVAIVTGAARGIGAATTGALAAAGWSVLAVDVCADDARLSYRLGTEEELRAVAASAGPGTVEALVADAAAPAAVARVVELAAKTFGGLDAYVAAAGAIAGGAPHWELDPAGEEAVLDICLRGVLHGARAAVPELLRRPQPRAGRFLADSSAAGIRGLPMLASYCAAKAGVLGFVRALAAELRGTGITANAVCPGSTRTAMLQESAALYGLADGEAFAAQQALERLIEPDEVAALLVWLAGPGGAAVTGAALPIDGGLSI